MKQIKIYFVPKHKKNSPFSFSLFSLQVGNEKIIDLRVMQFDRQMLTIHHIISSFSAHSVSTQSYHFPFMIVTLKKISLRFERIKEFLFVSGEIVQGFGRPKRKNYHIFTWEIWKIGTTQCTHSPTHDYSDA